MNEPKLLIVIDGGAVVDVIGTLEMAVDVIDLDQARCGEECEEEWEVKDGLSPDDYRLEYERHIAMARSEED